MKQTYKELLLLLLLVAQILFLIFYHPNFALYIDIVVILLFLTAGYMAYRYFAITRKMPVRIVGLRTGDGYELMLERERRKELDKLMDTKQMKQWEEMRMSRRSSGSKLRKEDQEFLRELEEKQTEIFDEDEP